MLSLTIVIGRGTPVVWTLLFKTKEAIAAALTSLDTNGDVTIKDDFGQRVHAKKADIIATMDEDMLESRNAHIERALHDARMKVALQSRATADNTLKAAALSQGPSMLSPMGGFNGMRS